MTIVSYFFFFNDTATTEIYTLSPTRRSSDLIELSLEGCRLRTGERFLASNQIRVEVAFTINGIAFRFSGVTQWTDNQHVVGIRLLNVTSRRRDELAEVLCEVEADHAAKAEKKAAEKLAAEAQPPEKAAPEQVQR